MATDQVAVDADESPPKHVMSAADVRRAVTRIAHEVIERNSGPEDAQANDLVVIGLQRGGVWLAEALGAALSSIVSPTAGNADTTPTEPTQRVPVGSLDVSFHRDDVGLRPIVPGSVTDIPVSLDGRTVILCDDVLYTGRTVRAALEAINDYGRPRAVQLAVIIDRGHRELPIRPDYVGKNLPTSRDESVSATADGVAIR
jgi:pyrimidine operon attenuation protein / uracil phosphoribosyltransferase